MAIIYNEPAKAYYDKGNHGNYQFTSLHDIINQFMLVYVGEDKIISKAKRLDVAFHAQRALAELSFDTLKSCKAQEITVPASLKMKLPQDYVNYTKISTVDSAGIKHLLYPTSKTSNPFPIKQDANNDYVFNPNGDLVSTTNLILNGDFDDNTGWTFTGGSAWSIGDFSILQTNGATYAYNNVAQGQGVAGYMEISAPEIIEGRRYIISYDVVVLPTAASLLILANHTTVQSTLNSDPTDNNVDLNSNVLGNNSFEWIQGPNNVGKIKLYAGNGFDGIIDNIKVVRVGSGEESSAWSSYKSGTPSENNNDDYEDDTYWPMNGQRYGLDPQHAQVNGSFYIDCVSGNIHFSSNISGKTVILDYISDSLGTDGEMQVHKFAEEAMYKWISHAILSGKANIPEYQVLRLKKERFAAIRTAKLRLSNLKLEELTQILRGKSKQIKH